MAELIDIANAMFRDRSKWKNITDDDKQKFFFIYNRYFSKKFPKQAQLLNVKSINSEWEKLHHISAMDTWFIFMQSMPYPKWLWSKSSGKIKADISDSEFLYLMKEFDLKKDDIDILNRFYPDVVKEEVSYYREIQKQTKIK